MKLYYYDITTLRDDDALRQLITPQRRAQLDRYRRGEDRLRSLAAGLLLHRVLGVVTDQELCYNEYGKPRLKDRTEHFNLAHGGDLVVLAVDSEPVGVDLERIRPYPEKVATRVFTPAEQDYLNAAGELGFFRLWCAKEAVMKADGRGFSLPPESFTVLGGEDAGVAIGDKRWYIGYAQLSGHLISTASLKKESVQLIPMKGGGADDSSQTDYLNS